MENSNNYNKRIIVILTTT